jgi:type VI secretion system secreted protein Hcp
MSVDMFLCLGPAGSPVIKGESKDSKHPNEINILSFSFGVANTGTANTGGGSGSGRASFQDIHIVKSVDKASPTLMEKCATGEHIKEAHITLRKAGGGKQGGEEYYKIKLSQVLVSSFQNAANSHGDAPSESISLNFAEVQFDYYPQKADGTLDGKVHGGYNISNNKTV